MNTDRVTDLEPSQDADMWEVKPLGPKMKRRLRALSPPPPEVEYPRTPMPTNAEQKANVSEARRLLESMNKKDSQ